MKNQQDIKRLGKVVGLCEKIVGLAYHMDEKEYKRMREYISSRFSISLAYENPAIPKKVALPEDK